MTAMRILLGVVLALGGCAHLAEREASTAIEEASARNTASFDAALAAAVRHEGARLLPQPAQEFVPGSDCSRSRRAAQAPARLPVVLKQARGPEVTVDCDASLAAIQEGNTIEATDGSGAEVSVIFSPRETSFLGRAKEGGGFVHFKPLPQVVTRTMTMVTPGLGCCCESPNPDAPAAWHFWVLAGHDLNVRSVNVPFEFERVELRCDPRAPQ